MTVRQNFFQFLRFGVVGTIGAVVDFGSYGIMTRLLHWGTVFCISAARPSFRTDLAHLSQCTYPSYAIVAANMVSVFLAISSNFLLNKFWTFRDHRGNLAAQGVGYLALSVIAWALNQFLTGIFVSSLPVLHTVFGTYTDVAAKILAVLIVLFVNFGGSKLFIFRSRSQTETTTHAE